ncbi:MAG: NAD(P)H-hydrate dehydratase [Gallionella sp.]|nr:NAD(P)H-hydrate dehydratase [Gallionella sp.]
MELRHITQQQLAGLLPQRPKDSHKALFGAVCVVGGAAGMTGAALLAGRAALKLGAGCIHVGLLTDNAPAVDFVQLELMLHQAAAALKLPNITVLAAGCGMGTSLAAHDLLLDALNSDIPLVLDADALNLITIHSDLRDLAVARKADTVLTPHPGEAARLLNCSTAEIQADRVVAVQKINRIFACSVLLKGADSLCATRDGQLFVNHTGNPGMSAPGMGDVLAGMIAAFIAQGLKADDALLLAVHLHGAAGDELAKQTAIGMTATEVTDQARQLLNIWASQS